MAVIEKTMEEALQVEGAEIFVEMLNRQGVEYIFMNPGTDTVPIQEALAKFHVLGKRTPKVVLCLHEFVAMSAAHGYFMVSGKPQVVLVHVGVGTQQLGGALHNAHRSRAAVLLCAGTTPYTSTGETRGARNSYVHWLQDQYDQPGTVRDYVKWYYEMKCMDHIQEAVPRAFQISMTEPCGPVYLMLPRELLLQKNNKKLAMEDHHPPAIFPEADSVALSNLAQWLVDAEMPLIMTGASGKNINSVAPLMQLAETLAIPVIDSRHRMNFSYHHPCWQGADPSPFLTRADLILIIDHDIPYMPSSHCPSPGAKVVYLDMDPVKMDIPLWTYTADMLLYGDSAKSLPTLVKLVKKILNGKDQAKYHEKLGKLRQEHEAKIEKWTKSAIAKSRNKPIETEWLAYCINKIVDENTILCCETITNSTPINQLISTHQPGNFFTNGGSCLGWGLGAALGAKLAAPDKTVISLVGDGSFLFGLPIATLWAAQKQKAPFLIVIINNRIYNAPKQALTREYKESYSQKYNEWVGLDIDPPPDYTLIAQSCGAYGERVEEPDQIMGSLNRALDEVRGGRAALLDVIIRKP